MTLDCDARKLNFLRFRLSSALSFEVSVPSPDPLAALREALRLCADRQVSRTSCRVIAVGPSSLPLCVPALALAGRRGGPPWPIVPPSPPAPPAESRVERGRTPGRLGSSHRGQRANAAMHGGEPVPSEAASYVVGGEAGCRRLICPRKEDAAGAPNLSGAGRVGRQQVWGPEAPARRP